MDLDNATIWLQNKIGTTNTNRKTANRGCVLLHGHVDHIPHLIKQADSFIKNSCRKSKPAGQCKLTQISLKIGEYTILRLGLGVAPFWSDHTRDKIAIGNLLLSALHGFGYVKIMRDMDWTGHPLRAPYIVKRLRHTPAFISEHTSFEPIEPISHIWQGNNAPLIKGWSHTEQPVFEELLEKPFVAAANTLQSTAWTVNEDVYQILNKIHRHTIPDPDSIQVPDEPGPEQKARQRDKSRAEASLEIYRKADMCLNTTFWQYVDFDWRGRVYYKESFFNYQGADLARGLLQFAEGKPLGESGNFWLAVHTANSFNMTYKKDDIPDWCEADYRSYLDNLGLEDISVDKMTLEDRARWTREHIDEIVDGRETLFLSAEKPVVFLACCIEWSKADSNDYVCHLPIPIDGSNNGWQHLGAMSKDPITGDLVGLTSVEIPRDFYVRCAQNLKDRLPQWFAERDMPMASIRKGIAKRGAMTRAYSAGATTIADNMESDIWQEGYDSKYNITREDCVLLAKELTEAVAAVCPGPLDVMGYLQKIAENEINSGADSIEWTSPSGFPVKQVYNLTKDMDIRGTISPVHGSVHDEPIGAAKKGAKGNIYGYTGQIMHSCHIDIGRPDRKKIASAISPNFVHSQDAAHMALVLSNWHGPFGAVHDSFSCHAADVETLMEMTRLIFVDMYDKEDFFSHLRDSILTSVDGFDTPQPIIGELDIHQVMKSDFFFA